MDKRRSLSQLNNNKTIKIAISISALLLMTNLLLGAVMINNSRSALKTLIQNRMLDIAKSAADMLDGDVLRDIQAEDKGTPEYSKINDTLAVFQDNIDLKYIYCIRAASEKEFVFTIDPTIEDPGVFGDPIVYTDALYEASKGVASVDDEPYTDAWGKFYSAYSPVFDSKGQVAGIVAVDFDAEWYDSQIEKQTKSIILCSILSVIIGIGLLLFATGRIGSHKMDTLANSMITALSSEYRSVYYVDLDKNDGICYQSHTEIDSSIKKGDHFDYLESMRAYADAYVTDKYREAFLDFINPDSIRQGLKSERIITLRYVVYRNGRESYEMLRMAGVRHPEDREDGLVHAMGMGFTDVDEETRRTLNQSQALSDALAEAEVANKAKTTFLSNMSHEIRTPMNAIIGLNNIALEEPDIPDKTRDHLEKIGAAADHLLKIINNILDMSRIESGRISVQNEEFSLPKMIEQINAMIAGQCNDKGVSWICEMKGEAGEFYIGDEMKIKQVLINILGNAVKFTPEGGTVSFITERTMHYDDKSAFKFVIADTGIGMSEDYIPKLYEPFSQEDYTIKSKYGSTGLGMSITKSFVDMMNGEIRVDSRKNEGTTFTVTLTLEDSQTAIEGVPESKEDTQDKTPDIDISVLQGKRVLLAEDMPINAEIMLMLLAEKGMEAEWAENGKIAVDMYESHDADYYDAVLMDMRMPEMDGLEASKAIRAMDKKTAKTIPIIALTANAFEEDVQRSLQAGLNAHISKPVDPDVLFVALVKLISKEYIDKGLL